MEHWGRLPTELRLSIYAYLINAVQQDPVPTFAQYSVVCQEWRHHFEPLIFQHLALDQYRLEAFKTFVCSDANRVAHVKWILLHVKLPAYNVNVVGEPPEESQLRATVFTTTVQALMALMSSWKRAEGNGVILELAASSPSDQSALQVFRNAKETPVPGLNWITMPSQAARDAHRNSEAARAVLIRDSSNKLLLPIQRCPVSLGGKLPSQRTRREANSKAFPIVKAITGLEILRRTRHIISPGILAPFLRYSLQNLRTFHHEKWRSEVNQDNRFFISTYWALLHQGLPPTLQSLTIFDELYGEIHMRRQPKLRGTGGEELAMKLAQSSGNLQHLAISFVVDAEDFFFSFPPSHIVGPNSGGFPPDKYPNLETIALTCSIIRPNARPSKLVHILSSIADKFLRRTPRLRLLEIWNAGAGYGGVFRYCDLQNGSAEIEFRSSWGPPDMTQVFRAWHNVLSPAGAQTVITTTAEQIAKRPRHYLDFLPELKSSGSIMTNDSRNQVETEARVRSLRVDRYFDLLRPQ